MRSTLLKFLARLPGVKRGEEGQDLVEYALLCTLVSLAVIVSMPGIASGVSRVFTNARSTLSPRSTNTGSHDGSDGVWR